MRAVFLLCYNANMSIANIISFGENIINKYLPAYINWLSGKLDANNSFGTLALVGFLSMLFLLIYVFIRSNRA